jgi:hypothetical protein
VGGDLEPDDFNLIITPVNPAGDPIPLTSGEAIVLPPGDYIVSETESDDYVAGNWGGDCDEDGAITLTVGGEGQNGIGQFVCTITNVVVEDRGGTTTDTTLVLGADLPMTGSGPQMLALMIGGFGMVLLGYGLVLLAKEQRARVAAF